MSSTLSTDPSLGLLRSLTENALDPDYEVHAHSQRTREQVAKENSPRGRLIAGAVLVVASALVVGGAMGLERANSGVRTQAEQLRTKAQLGLVATDDKSAQVQELRSSIQSLSRTKALAAPQSDSVASAAGVALDMLLTKAGPFDALGKTDAERDEPNAGPVDPERPVAGVVGVAAVLVASASAAAAPARATARSKDSNSCTLGVAARIMTICSSNARNQSPRYTAVGDTRARFTGLISAPWSPPGALIKACAVVAAWTDTRAASRFWRAE